MDLKLSKPSKQQQNMGAKWCNFFSDKRKFQNERKMCVRLTKINWRWHGKIPFARNHSFSFGAMLHRRMKTLEAINEYLSPLLNS